MIGRFSARLDVIDLGTYRDKDMQKSAGYILRKCLALLCLSVLCAMPVAHAEGGKEGESLYHKLEPFTVNLLGLKQVIQVSVTLKLAKPEVDPKVSLYIPSIRHEVILLLSGKSAEELETADGKKKLIAETKIAVNKALGLNAKEGVAEVLFESFIIQ